MYVPSASEPGTTTVYRNRDVFAIVGDLWSSIHLKGETEFTIEEKAQFHNSLEAHVR